MVAIDDGRIVGALQYSIDEDGLEVMGIAADPPGHGAGRALLIAAAQLSSRLRLTTTNDNLPAIGLYQSLDFRMVAIRPDAVTQARALKPQIPRLGYRGIPMRDEIDLVREG